MNNEAKFICRLTQSFVLFDLQWTADDEVLVLQETFFEKLAQREFFILCENS